MRADVLFVCVHNAGRSQMAKAFFNTRASELELPFRSESAGTIPGKAVHPEVVAALAEVGLNISAEQPRLLTDDLLNGKPRVITMGCAVDAEACPSLRIEDVVDWGLPDLKGQPIAEVRQIRDEIARRVNELLAELASGMFDPIERPRAR